MSLLTELGKFYRTIFYKHAAPTVLNLFTPLAGLQIRLEFRRFVSGNPNGIPAFSPGSADRAGNCLTSRLASMLAPPYFSKMQLP